MCVLLTKKEKIEHKIRNIFEEQQKHRVTVNWYNIDDLICCCTSVGYITSDQFKQFVDDFRKTKYSISITPLVSQDEKDPTKPFLKIQIIPRNQNNISTD
jgi:hypothetical protein